MCGILVSVAIKGASGSAHNGLAPWIAARGRDSLQTRQIEIPFPDSLLSLVLTFTSSVLHLRGHEVTVQPLESQNSDVLCWNGEIWQGLTVQDDENDGLKLLVELTSGKQVSQVMGNIEGPWAMVFYDSKAKKLWYGRDCLGRRSLMKKTVSETGELLLSSVGVDMDGWEEVGVDGIWCLDLQEFINSRKEYLPRLIPWVFSDQIPEQGQEEYMVRCYSTMNKSLPSDSLDENPSTPFRLLQILTSALSIRTRTIPTTHTHLSSSSIAVLPRVAILFSGGLDCSVLAWLIHTLLPPSESIDLINVAFENPRTVAANNTKKEDVYKVCPDRITGRAGWQELCALSKGTGRVWRFVEINVPYAETLSHKPIVLQLMYPNNSVMDLSIAMAFYFAARGEGYEVHKDGSRTPYTTPSKVFFSGLGADEQLGGYSRHSAAWKRSNGSWAEVINELDHDLSRLPYRNLGRDDRIISHFSREIRYPFLDEQVISFLSSLRADEKCRPGMQEGLGDKRLLRRVAERCGLYRAANEKKRAVQFGSRSAKMEVEAGRVKGGDRVV